MKPKLRSMPLEVPAPGRAYSRTAALLGWHPAAAVLATMGWITVPQVTVRDTSRSGGTSIAFFIGARPGVPGLNHKTAEKLVREGGNFGPKGMAATDPHNPYLAALAAVENLAALIAWHRAGGMLPGAARAPVARLQCPYLWLSADARPLVRWPGGAVRVGIMRAETAAAMIACGFVPFPDVVTDGASGRAGIGFGGESVTMPGFTVEMAMDGVRQVDAAAPRRPAEGLQPALTLPGAPAGDEHPFFYALRAARNVERLHAMAARAARDPIIQRINPFNSQRTALVTNHLLGSGQNPRLLRELEKHLKKSA